MFINEASGGVQVLETWQITANHLLSRVDDTLQSNLGSGSSVPDGDGRGEDGLNNGGVEVHHCLWQVELLQLPQEVHPLLGFLVEKTNVQLQLEVLGDDVPKKRKDSTESTGESHGVMGTGVAELFLESTTIFTVWALSSKLFCTKSPDAQSPTCRRAQWGWCHTQTSKADWWLMTGGAAVGVWWEE